MCSHIVNRTFVSYPVVPQRTMKARSERGSGSAPISYVLASPQVARYLSDVCAQLVVANSNNSIQYLRLYMCIVIVQSSENRKRAWCSTYLCCYALVITIGETLCGFSQFEFQVQISALNV